MSSSASRNKISYRPGTNEEMTELLSRDAIQMRNQRELILQESESAQSDASAAEAGSRMVRLRQEAQRVEAESAMAKRVQITVVVLVLLIVLGVAAFEAYQLWHKFSEEK